MVFRAVEYFSYLRKLLGFRAALIFSAYYFFYKTRIVRPKLYKIPIGSINFYCTSVKQFAGLFMEIFLKEYYYLEKTDLPIEVIDCGSNIGVSLLYTKLRAPNARVKCFEPNPAAAALLKKNIQKNGWEKEVSVHVCALAKTKGTAEFFVERDEETSFGASLFKYMAGKSSLTSFDVTTDLLSDHVSNSVDFLKMDIEGGEFDVLENLLETNKLSQISQIQMEYHYHPEFFPRPLSEMLKFLETAGFRTSIKATKEPHSLVGRNKANAYMVYAWRDAMGY